MDALGKITTTLAAAPKEKEINKKDLVLIPDLIKYLENIINVSDCSATKKQSSAQYLAFVQQAAKNCDCFAESWEAYAKMRHKMPKHDGKLMHLSYESALQLVKKMIDSKALSMKICEELDLATANQWRSILYKKDEQPARIMQTNSQIHQNSKILTPLQLKT
jgi:hypothetical protein